MIVLYVSSIITKNLDQVTMKSCTIRTLQIKHVTSMADKKVILSSRRFQLLGKCCCLRQPKLSKGSISRFNKSHVKFQHTIGLLWLCLRLLTSAYHESRPATYLESTGRSMHDLNAIIIYTCLYIIHHHTVLSIYPVLYPKKYPNNAKCAFAGHEEIVYACVK